LENATNQPDIDCRFGRPLVDLIRRSVRESTRRCETAKLVVLRLKTSNNRSYQNLKIGVRLSRYSHGHLAVFRWVQLWCSDM